MQARGASLSVADSGMTLVLCLPGSVEKVEVLLSCEKIFFFRKLAQVDAS
jgi:hypothetical protein